MTEIKKNKKADKNLIKFADTASLVFDDFLNSRGFESELKEIEDFFCTLIYRKQETYIKISASTHPRDYQNNYNIILGEGSSDWPDTDWNSVALWWIKKEIFPDLNAKEYSLTDFEKIDYSLRNAKNELENYGDTFLNADLTVFRKVRQSINQQREPYKIHQKDNNRRLKTIIDNVSKKLKEKFSWLINKALTYKELRATINRNMSGAQHPAPDVSGIELHP